MVMDVDEDNIPANGKFGILRAAYNGISGFHELDTDFFKKDNLITLIILLFLSKHKILFDFIVSITPPFIFFLLSIDLFVFSDLLITSKLFILLFEFIFKL